MIPLGFNRNTAQGQQALAEIAAMANPLIRTIQRSPRAADMPPDPVPVFNSDPRFPSNIVNEVHQDLRRQATATGGVTGNNDVGFNYETRMQAGENIVPTGLNASQAVVIVDDAIAPMQINRHATDIDDNEIVGFSSYGNNINRSVPTQSAYADKMGVIPYEQLKNVGSVGEGSNPRRDLSNEQRAAIDDKKRLFKAEYDHPAGNEIADLQIANLLYDKSKNVLGTADLTPEARAMEGAKLIAQERKARELQSVINDVESKFGTGKPGITHQAPVVEKQIPLSASMNEDDYYDLMYQNKVQQEPYGLPPVDRNPYADQATVMQDNRGSGTVDNQAGNILNKTLATGAAVGGGLGAMALINNALGDSSGSSGGGNAIAQSDSPAPTPRAHFVIDKTNDTAQSFIDRGDGQLQPYKTMDVAGARDAWSKAKQAGWSTSFE